MILCIDTTQNQEVEIAITKGDKAAVRKKFTAKYKQAETLLLEIDKMLIKQSIVLNDIEKIKAANQGGSFTSLRIGVVTANALGFALGIPVIGTAEVKNKKNKKLSFDVIEPIYGREPDITISKKQIGASSVD